MTSDVGARPVSARDIALDLLGGVLRRQRPLDDAIAGHAALAGLAARDRGFVRLMVATTLRRLGQIDEAIRACLQKPLPDRAASAQDGLRIGAAQLLFLGTPAHAAVDSAVAMAEAHYKPLLNAVLRRLSRDSAAIIAGQDAALLNTPDWLWQSWSRAYGETACRGIAEAHLVEPPIDLTVKGEPDAWREALGATLLPTGTLRRPAGGLIADLPGFDQGAWWVQDAAAAIPARLLGDIRGCHVIDACAAPGGKTAQLAAAGAKVVAIDRAAPRARRLAENLARLGLAADVQVADIAAWRPLRLADAILLDAPCTATGAIRRHPDVARLKKPLDVARLAAMQDRLLAAAIEMVRSGGTIVYCTCSLQPEEGPERIRALLERVPSLSRIAITPEEVGGLAEFVTADGDLRTLPCHLADQGGIDGFYAARLRRG